MPNFDLPVREALTELGITKTHKSIVDLDSGEFNEDETFSFTKGELKTTIEIDPDLGRAKLGALFGMSRGYAKKMPWSLFVTNIDYWANEGRVLLEWLEDEESEHGQLVRAVSAEKTILTRDQLLSEFFSNLDDSYRLRWLSIAGDVIYIDVQITTYFGVRLVADLSLKKGIKLYGVMNVGLQPDLNKPDDEEPQWAPVVVTEAKKVKTRGRDTVEVYEAIRADLETFVFDNKELEQILWDGLSEQYFHFDFHSQDCLTALATSKEYGIGSKFMKSRFPSHTNFDTKVLVFIKQGADQNFDGSKAPEVHAYQTFFGDIMRQPQLVKTCSFCYSRLEEEDNE